MNLAGDINGSLYWCLFIAVGVCGALSRHPKVLLISFDGFRYDLLNSTMVPNIYKFASGASWFTNGSRSQFLTYTAPNHLGIVTGLYEESHGIVANYFYDPDKKEFFDYFNSTQTEGVVNSSLNEYWYKGAGEPIWLTNERADTNRQSAAFYWPNSEAHFASPPHKPSFFRSWTTYRNLSQWMIDVDEIIEAFTRDEKPINFAAWYLAEPDHTLHGNGFYNGALVKKLKEMDTLFGYFVSAFESHNLFDQVNVIFTADHGHAEITDEKHVMCLKDYLPNLHTSDVAADRMIYPRDEAHASEIYKNLTDAVTKFGFDVKIYLKKDFPEKFHYKNNDRVGGIIVEPGVGSAVSMHCTAKEMNNTYGPGSNVKFNSSTHGQDPDRPEMRALLVMKGPNITDGIQISDVPLNIDLYPFVCHLLGITPAANNGSLSVLRRALRQVNFIDKNVNVVADSLGFLVFFIPPFIIVVLYLAYGCRHTIMKSDPNWARTQTGYRPLNMDNINTDGDGSFIKTELGHDAVAMSELLREGGSSEDEF